jgi:replication factor C subunit 2/4
VAEAEGVALDADTLEALLDTSSGDLRKAIMHLQSAYQLYGDDMNAESVVEISGE